MIVMTEHPLDRATSLTPENGHRWRGKTTGDYPNIVGPFGGITAATLLRAVLDDASRQGDPVSMTVNYCAPIADDEFEIVTKIIRTGKNTQHWSLELLQSDEIRATATIVLGVRRETFDHHPAEYPSVPTSNAVERFNDLLPNNWMGQYDFRFIEGSLNPNEKIPEMPQSSRTVAWVKDRIDRPLDFLSLASMADSFFFRLLHVRRKLVPNGTVSMTTHFLGSADEIAEQDTTALLGIAESERFHASFHNQEMQLWGKNGKLLATGTQIVWYKD